MYHFWQDLLDNTDKRLKSINKIIKFIKKHLKSINRIYLYICVAIISSTICLLKHKQRLIPQIFSILRSSHNTAKHDIDVLISEITPDHRCFGGEQVLHQLISHQIVVNHEVHGSMNCEVESLIYQLMQSKYNLKVIGILLHQCPSSPMRKAFTVPLYNSRDNMVHAQNLKYRRFLQKNFLTSKLHYKYYNFYTDICANYDKFMIFKQTYPNKIFSTHIPNLSSQLLPMGAYYFINIGNRVLVFTERGGIQYDKSKGKTISRELLYHNYSIADFQLSIYAKYMLHHNISF
jgi:phenylpyruvate tautomerase PptA (4-oxalocrotonate tautomerase family)